MLRRWLREWYLEEDRLRPAAEPPVEIMGRVCTEGSVTGGPEKPGAAWAKPAAGMRSAKPRAFRVCFMILSLNLSSH